MPIRHDFVGWQYDTGYGPDNRVYGARGKIKYQVATTTPETRHEYRVNFNVSVYLCDSGAEQITLPVIRRKIYNEIIIRIYDEVYTSGTEGGLDEWVEDVTAEAAAMYTSISASQVGAGLIPCECLTLDGKNYKIEVNAKEYIPPVVLCEKPIIEMLEFLKGLRAKYTGKDKETVEKEIRRLGDEHPGCKQIVDEILGE
jgi:hypothetical protein